MGKSQIVRAALRATKMAGHTFFAKRKKDFGVRGRRSLLRLRCRRPHLATRPWCRAHRRRRLAAVGTARAGALPGGAEVAALVLPLAAVGTVRAALPEGGGAELLHVPDPAMPARVDHGLYAP
jgi:hypothetical protein